MNNNKDDKEKEPIKIDIENLEDMSEEDILKLINEIANKDLGDNKKNRSFFDKVKIIIKEFVKKLIIDFLLVFTINFFFKVIDAEFINFIIYFMIFNFLDYVFNTYVNIKFPLIKVISFGFVNFIITFLSFIVSAIICSLFIEIVFTNFITYLIAVIIFVLIKKFVLKYIFKLRKKGSQNVSSK